MFGFLKLSNVKALALLSTTICWASYNEAFCSTPNAQTCYYSIEDAARDVFTGIKKDTMENTTFSEMKEENFGYTQNGTNLKESFKIFNALCYITAAETSGYHYIICDKEYIPDGLKKCYELLSGSRNPVELEAGYTNTEEWTGYTTYNRLVFSPQDIDKFIEDPAIMNALLLIEKMFGEEKSKMYSIFHYVPYKNKAKKGNYFDLDWYYNNWKAEKIINNYKEDLISKLKDGKLV